MFKFFLIFTTSLLIFINNTIGAEIKHIKIVQSKNETLTNARADRIINRMNKILINKQYGGEKCPQFKFKRKGSVATDDDIDEFINSRAKHDKLFNNSAYSLYLVRGIGRCGSITGDNIAGCARRNKSVIVKDFRTDDQISAIIWLHEFAHTQGLSYATNGTSHITRQKALMLAGAVGSNQSITEIECNHLAKSSARFPTKQSDANAVTVNRAEEKMQETAQLSQLLNSVRLGSYPIERLRALSPHQISLLRSYLFNPEYKIMWSNIIDYLAITGSSSDVETFKAFLGLHASEIDRDVERAKLQIPFAMGVLANRFGSQSAISFLTQSANPHSAPQLSGSTEEQLTLSREFAVRSTKYLALAGKTFPQVEKQISNSRNANRAGQFKLGVDENFFDEVDVLRKDVIEKGLDQVLSRDSN